MKIEHIEAKSIIVSSNIPDKDYVVNPYTGCQFGCLYCYATFTGRFVNEPRSNWGDYVYVKTNAVELAREQLGSWGDKRRHSSVLFSSVTDPYHGIESRYLLTRGILEAFADQNYPGPISILTKSPLVLHDVDLLKLINSEVGLTITTTDDQLGRFLEVKAPLASRRLETVSKLVQEGIQTYVFVGPLLPHFRYQSEQLEELFQAIAETGTSEIYVEHINLSPYIKSQMREALQGEPEEIQAIYRGSQTQDHRQVLDDMVEDLSAKYDLRMRFGGTIYHPEPKPTD